MKRIIKAVMSVILIMTLLGAVSASAVSSNAQKDILGSIKQKNREAVKTYGEMQTTDEILASHQQNIDANLDKLLVGDKNSIAADANKAVSDLNLWGKKINDLEMSYEDLYRMSEQSQLNPGDYTNVKSELNDLKRNIDRMKTSMNSIGTRSSNIKTRVG